MLRVKTFKIVIGLFLVGFLLGCRPSVIASATEEAQLSNEQGASACVSGSAIFTYHHDVGPDETFTIPENCTELFVMAWGAGGGGDTAINAGGGAYVETVFTNLTGTLTIRVGGAGTGTFSVTGAGGYPNGGNGVLGAGGGGSSSVLTSGGLVLVEAGGGAGESSEYNMATIGLEGARGFVSGCSGNESGGNTAGDAEGSGGGGGYCGGFAGWWDPGQGGSSYPDPTVDLNAQVIPGNVLSGANTAAEPCNGTCANPGQNGLVVLAWR